MQGYELEMIGQLLMAFVFGIVIGYDRERSGKPAGIRTQMLLCVGSALLAGISVHIAGKYGVSGAEPSHLMAQIVAGIGFVGAGVILKSHHRVSGVTTAATIWITAAVGIAIGSGFYVPAIAATILVLLIEPLGELQYRLGLKANPYVLKVSKSEWKQTRELLTEMKMRHRITNIHHAGRQATIYSSEEKKQELVEKLGDKKVQFEIFEVED